jgi:hypothetical protein
MKTTKTAKQPEKNKFLQYMLYGLGAIAGVFLLSSFSSGPTNDGSTGGVPAPPIGPDGSNPNDASTFGLNPADPADYVKWLELLGYTAGAILVLLTAYYKWKDTKEGKDAIEAALGTGLNWNVGFENKGFFSQPGDWGFKQDGGIGWGLNPGGAFKFNFASGIGVGNFNSFLSQNNFSQDAFNSLFNATNFNFSNYNLFSSGFTNSVGNWNNW